MANNVNVYRLIGSKTPLSWGLKQHEVGILDNGVYRFINYFKGSSSIFVDDDANKNRKPTKITFEFNDDKHTEFYANKGDVMLNKYLQAHPAFGIDYELFSEDVSNQKKLDDFDKKERALELIKSADDFETQARAMAVFGNSAYGWDAIKSKAELKERAFTDPDSIINKFSAKDFESKYLAALAFSAKIITENQFNNAVIWNDEYKNTIVPLAVGENGIEKLGDLIASGTDEARTLIQEIGKRIAKEEPKSEKFDLTGIDLDKLNVEELRALYLKAVGKEIAIPHKNNEAMMRKHIKEASTSAVLA